MKARTAVTQYRDEYFCGPHRGVDVNGKTVSATPEQLGYNCEIGDVVASLMRVGKEERSVYQLCKNPEIATTPAYIN